MLFKTDEAQKRNAIPASHDEWYEHNIRRKTVTNQQLTTYRSSLLVPKEDVTEMKKRLLYTTIGVKDFGNLADQVAGATAQLALSFGLNPFNGEIWPIPQRQGSNITGFSVFVGYKGLHRAARRVARDELRSDFSFNKPEKLSPEEVIERGADRCFRCGGSGKYSSGKDCFKCAGQGKFDAKEVVAVRIAIALFCKKRMAEEVGWDFEPTWGIGVWHPGDNIPEGKDPEWQATKRAKADALRQEFDLPFSYGEQGEGREEEPPLVIIHPPEPHPAVEAASIAGISYDDEIAFIEMVEEAIGRLGFESEGHVMEALVDLDHKHLSIEDTEVSVNVLANWLAQQDEQVQPELPLEEAA